MKIFISHAVANKNIAQSLAEALEATKENVTTFLASRPINSRQVYAIDVKEQLIAVFESIGLSLADPDIAVSKIIAQAAADTVTGEREPAWEGIQIGGVFYAWAGSLLGLKDLDPVSPPAGLLEEIEKRGLKPRWANRNRLSHHIERGLAQVFATDRKTWRRPVSDQNRPLMVSAQQG